MSDRGSVKGKSGDSSVFRQQVRMAAVQVAGLRPEELAQALAYEVEPFSGISATDAEVVYQAVADADPTVRVYDVTVRSRRRRGGRAKGLDRWLCPARFFAIAVILSMAGDGILLVCRRSAAEKTVNERRPLQAQLNRLKAEERTVRAAAAEIRDRRVAAEHAQNEAAALRTMHADVLADLAAACGESAVLTSIASAEDFRTIRVQAIGASNEAAADVMQALSVRVAVSGWRLVPGTIAVSGSGATVSFGFELVRQR